MPAGRRTGDSTEVGSHGNKGLVPPPPPPPPHLHLLGHCCKPQQRGYMAGCMVGRTGSRHEGGVGLGWWEYLGSV